VTEVNVLVDSVIPNTLLVSSTVQNQACCKEDWSIVRFIQFVGYCDDRVLGLPRLPLKAEEHQDMNDSHYQPVNYLSDVVTHVGVGGFRIARVK
jgi:hypothetical protein